MISRIIYLTFSVLSLVSVCKYLAYELHICEFQRFTMQHQCGSMVVSTFNTYGQAISSRNMIRMSINVLFVAFASISSNWLLTKSRKVEKFVQEVYWYRYAMPFQVCIAATKRKKKKEMRGKTHRKKNEPKTKKWIVIKLSNEIHACKTVLVEVSHIHTTHNGFATSIAVWFARLVCVVITSCACVSVCECARDTRIFRYWTMDQILKQIYHN